MNNISNQMTAQTPSRFGMPACAHLSVVSAVRTAKAPMAAALTAAVATSGVDVRDRWVGALVQGRTGFAYIPGTTAWRPPSC